MEELSDLFRNKRYNRALFFRIKLFLQADIVHQRLFFELYIDGHSLPEQWFQNNVFCFINDPKTVEIHGIRVEKVITNPERSNHLLIMTERLPVSLEPNEYSASTMLGIAAPVGSLVSLFQEILSNAKPRQTA